MAAEPSATTTVGTLLNGTYLLERVIAEGGMGVVYEAQHLRLPKKLAVKVLGKPKDASLAETALPRFRREAEIAASLSHPHIVETFDFQVSEGGSPYLVMELLEGEDLNDRLKRVGRISVAAALRIVEEIAAALDHAHDKGVVHRDLKPANIFLSRRAGRDDFVKVLDFGVSKLIDAATLTQEKAMVGTPLYMSPEQAVGTQELTSESDVFSLGSIAFEMLTGRRAFAASSIPSILYQIVHGPTPQLKGRAPGLGPEVDDVFAKVLAKKKKDRFRRSCEFAIALRMAIRREPGAPSENELLAPDLAPVDDRGSGLYRAGLTGAGMTAVDSSTRAEELLPVRPPTRTATPHPSPLPAAGAPPSAASDAPPSLESELLGRGKRSTKLMVLGGVGLLLSAVVAFVALGQGEAPRPSPTVSALPPAATPPKPIVTQLPRPTAAAPGRPTSPANDFNPDVVEKHGDVQFIFRVVPRSATIFVDDKRVPGGKLTLPWQKVKRHVRVIAPGYRPITLSAPADMSQTFELHMERISRAPEPHKPKTAPPRHDAAPVQEL